jgi:DNA-binding winged helix-turn-helix (wHTH) protein
MRLAFAGCVFDSGTRQVTGRGGGVLAISPKAFQLLEALILVRPRAVSKDELHALLWPETYVEDANLSNLVGASARLGDDAKNPQIIRRCSDSATRS